jgi:ATP synthase in type III secretion protein N
MAGASDTELLDVLRSAPSVARTGKLTQAWGTTLRATGLDARIGQTCEIAAASGGTRVMAEVVGLAGAEAILTPLDPLHGIGPDAEVRPVERRAELPWGETVLGRVLDARGQPVDGLGPLGPAEGRRPLHGSSPDPMSRAPIAERVVTGIRAIDLMLTVGRGQRMGVFAPAGTGKSTLLGMIARHSDADVIVLGLIGERGREVREILSDVLGAEGLKRSVVVVATSDRPAMERVRAAHAATAIAEGFRSQGRKVLLLMDSVTRFARALREIGLSVGEAPVRRGFPSSVFAEMPRLFERAGADAQGSITAFYTVLVEDESDEDPIAEEVRSILDGHIVLTRALAQAGRYPAIDVLKSVSRLFPRVAEGEQAELAVKARAWLARHAELEFLIQVGEYKPGADPAADEAVQKAPMLAELFRQAVEERACFAESLAGLRRIAT